MNKTPQNSCCIVWHLRNTLTSYTFSLYVLEGTATGLIKSTVLLTDLTGMTVFFSSITPSVFFRLRQQQHRQMHTHTHHSNTSVMLHSAMVAHRGTGQISHNTILVRFCSFFGFRFNSF